MVAFIHEKHMKGAYIWSDPACVRIHFELDKKYFFFFLWKPKNISSTRQHRKPTYNVYLILFVKSNTNCTNSHLIFGWSKHKIIEPIVIDQTQAYNLLNTMISLLSVSTQFQCFCTLIFCFHYKNAYFCLKDLATSNSISFQLTLNVALCYPILIFNL